MIKTSPLHSKYLAYKYVGAGAGIGEGTGTGLGVGAVQAASEHPLG